MPSDLTWVEQTKTVEAFDTDAVRALESNPGWRLIATGNGPNYQTMLTYGWPWPDALAAATKEDDRD